MIKKIYIVILFLCVTIGGYFYHSSILNAAPWLGFGNYTTRQFLVTGTLADYGSRWTFPQKILDCTSLGLTVGGTCTTANIKNALNTTYSSCYIRDLEVLNGVVTDKSLSTGDFTQLMQKISIYCPSDVLIYTNGTNSGDYILGKGTQTDPYRFEGEDLSSTNGKATSIGYYFMNSKRIPGSNDIRNNSFFLPAGYYAVDIDGSSSLAYQAAYFSSGLTVGSGTSTSPYVMNYPPINCLTYKNTYTQSNSGYYIISRSGTNLMAYCDMSTDGGGYTMVQITNGINTCYYNAANSCKNYGMDIIVPRNLQHLTSIYSIYGNNLMGVYGNSAGNYTSYPMNSSNGTVASNRKSVDGGTWFLRSVAHSEPNGDYNGGGRLSMQGMDANGMIFNDGGASCYSSYICSPNDK